MPPRDRTRPSPVTPPSAAGRSKAARNSVGSSGGSPVSAATTWRWRPSSTTSTGGGPPGAARQVPWTVIRTAPCAPRPRTTDATATGWCLGRGLRLHARTIGGAAPRREGRREADLLGVAAVAAARSAAPAPTTSSAAERGHDARGRAGRRSGGGGRTCRPSRRPCRAVGRTSPRTYPGQRRAIRRCDAGGQALRAVEEPQETADRTSTCRRGAGAGRLEAPVRRRTSAQERGRRSADDGADVAARGRRPDDRACRCPARR